MPNSVYEMSVVIMRCVLQVRKWMKKKCVYYRYLVNYREWCVKTEYGEVKMTFEYRPSQMSYFSW